MIVFTKVIVFFNNRIKNGRKSFLQKLSFSKTIVNRFLKVQNEWVVFKNDLFFRKRNDLFEND